MTKSTSFIDDEPIDLIYYFSILFKYKWRITLFCISICSIVLLLLLLFVPKRYTSSAKILSNSNSASEISQMKAVAAQFGFAGGMDANLNSPEVYVEILSSRDLLDVIAQKKYQTVDDTLFRSLKDIYEIDTEKITDQRIKFVLYEILMKAISTSVDRQSQVITISCETIDPLMSSSIIDNLINELERFNNEVRTLKAKDNRIFIEGRLDETKEELGAAEETLNSFRENNRRILDSPQLQLELGRLSRDVKIQEEIYLTLIKEYELAKIQEIKDQPIFDIIEQTRIPLKKSYPKYKLNVLVSGFLSFIISVIFVIIFDNLKTNNLFERLEKGKNN